MAKLRLIGKTWYADFKNLSGKRVKRSLHTTREGEARQMLNVIESRVEPLKQKKLMVYLSEKSELLVDSISSEGVMDSSFYGWTRERWARMNPREQQAVIFTAFGGRCVYCKREVDIPLARDRKSLTRCVLDHKIPAISGGSDDIDNIVLSCQSCNSKKSDGRHDRYGASVIEQTDGLV